MRRAVAVVALLLAAACTGGGTTGKAQKVDLAPLQAAAALAPCPAALGKVVHLVLPCLGGGPDVVLDKGSTGVPTLVNVYGSWCGPCQREMPVLASFHALAGDKVALVGVDTEDEPRLALLFARDLKQHWPAVRDDEGRFLHHYGGGPPFTLFLDRAGSVVRVHRGEFRSLAELRAAVRSTLGVTV